MKWINIIGNPVVFMMLYLLLLIEGNENFGGFYVMYIVGALQAGLLYAKVAAIGLLFVFIGYVLNGQYLQPLKAVVYFSGLILMVLSLFIFFADGNKSATFELFIPIMTFILYTISGICFLYTTTLVLVRSFRQKLA